MPYSLTSFSSDQANHCYFERFEDFKYPGYRVSEVKSTGTGRVHLFLEPTTHPLCPKCGLKCRKIKDQRMRQVRDAPFHNCEEVWVSFPVRRVRCTCGCTSREQLPWVEPKARVTNAMVGYIQAFLRAQMSVTAVARMFSLSWETVKVCDKLQLEHLFSEIDFGSVRHLAIDEFSLFKGHRYATIVMDLKDRKVLWVGLGKTQKSIAPFFRLLQEKGLDQQIETCSMDMNAAYPRLVKQFLPKAKILYDGFHVMKKFVEMIVEAKDQCIAQTRNEIRQTINQKRSPGRRRKAKLEMSEPAPELRVEPSVTTASTENLRSLKRCEWVLVIRPDDLDIVRQERLNRLISDNALLAALHPLAAMIRDIWKTPVPEEAAAKIEDLRQLLHAINHRFKFEPAKKFAMMLKRRVEGIIYVGQYGLSTGPLEGANNKVKVIKRVAYGYRDLDYFFLKIKAAFPGIKNSPWGKVPMGCAVLRNGLWNPFFLSGVHQNFRAVNFPPKP